MPEELVKIESVSKFYGKVLGLNDITISFGRGITGLLGPNGAGKSTMIKLITGQIKPNIGSISVLGEKVWNNPSLNQRVGYCPEQESFYDSMTGLQFVTYLARLDGISKREAKKRAEEVLRVVGLHKDMKRPVGGYSKGMKQRAKIAQSLVNDPELLVLDEPLAGTDPLGRVNIIELIRDLVRDGKHLIISSHVLYEIERITDEVVLINNGKLVASGNIHDIRDSMDRFPLTVRVRTKESPALSRLLIGMEIVSSVSYGDDRNTLLARTSDPGRFYPDFQRIIHEEGLKIDEIDSPDDNLDAIFKYLVD
ncbi:MAG: ABC transporter ATP-binding protein [Thermoplasmatota archaeon]